MIPLSPPKSLSRRSKRLYRLLVPRRVSLPERMELLLEALAALDSADRCAAQIREEGLTVRTLATGATHRHPLLSTERDYRATFTRLWLALDLHLVPDVPDEESDEEDPDQDAEGEWPAEEEDPQ